jgi:hypothetical protein
MILPNTIYKNIINGSARAIELSYNVEVGKLTVYVRLNYISKEIKYCYCDFQ